MNGSLANCARHSIINARAMCLWLCAFGAHLAQSATNWIFVAIGRNRNEEEWVRIKVCQTSDHRWFGQWKGKLNDHQSDSNRGPITPLKSSYETTSRQVSSVRRALNVGTFRGNWTQQKFITLHSSIICTGHKHIEASIPIKVSSFIGLFAQSGLRNVTLMIEWRAELKTEL